MRQFFFCFFFFFFFQAEDGIRDVERSRGLGDVYKRQIFSFIQSLHKTISTTPIKPSITNTLNSLGKSVFNEIEKSLIILLKKVLFDLLLKSPFLSKRRLHL
eukprot:TRINITY_DN788_c0_g1_i4.p3 TRINITY_DN788_c0_g1~~TRINITY_DN788_c0_g1_i4.p3  ORF type:complete len:102 (-),score=27.63 TRINITY_DN788_c0_g1_i4:180-485(-)